MISPQNTVTLTNLSNTLSNNVSQAVNEKDKPRFSVLPVNLMPTTMQLIRQIKQYAAIGNLDMHFASKFVNNTLHSEFDGIVLGFERKNLLNNSNLYQNITNFPSKVLFTYECEKYIVKASLYYLIAACHIKCMFFHAYILHILIFEPN